MPFSSFVARLVRLAEPASRRPRVRVLLAWALAALGTVGTAPAHAASRAAESHPSRAFWLDIRGTASSTSAAGARESIRPRQFRSVTMDRASLAAAVSAAPRVATQAARQSPVVLSLPHPGGGFERFTVTESVVMEPDLAARHPEIRTYAGRGLDDRTADLRMDLSPLGLHVSVRSAQGAWYIEPLYHLDQSLYASYYGRDLDNVHGPLVEALPFEAQLALPRGVWHAAESIDVRGTGFAPGAQVRITVRNQDTDAAPRQVAHALADAEGAIATKLVADPYRHTGRYAITATDGRTTANVAYQVVGDAVSPNAVTGGQLRTYRLALVTDPSYATYFGGSANVTAAKVALINRVSQVYEYETSIRLVLIAGNDALNLDTAAQMTGANGPCGGTACYTAAQVASCGGGTLTRNRQVIGLLVGASNYDIGHIALGVNGGGIASLGVVGGNSKAQGCTGIPTPVGDFYAVDYVAHEMGHQFAGNHTFNGIVSNCSGGNRNAGTSVEPGSGSSIMAYAGICGTDNLQTHSDPYWSERSFDEITTYTSAAETLINEVQMGALTNFTTDGQQFQLVYAGSASAPIVRGINYSVAGLKAAIEAIPGWPAGATVTASAVGDTAFTITFGGTLTGVDASLLQLAGCTGGCSGYVGEIAKGGLTNRNGAVSPTGNNPPTVAALPSYTIPLRTPFVLTGSATDPDGDTVTYLWEQNDRGAAAGTGLISNTKANGPLFRQFGVRAVVSPSDTLLYGSPGENLVTTNPTRIFPDLVQILANNTNADTGVCPAASATPTGDQIDCFSEFLPTADYVGFGTNAGTSTTPPTLNFRLTARDGRGGVNSAATVLTLAPGTGPVLVTFPNDPVALDAGSAQTVTWNVAGTSAAPISTANVRISLSTDSGQTFPTTLAASVPNTGSASVALPSVVTGKARIKVEAVGNIWFDVSNADFTIRLLAGDLNGDGAVDCADLAIVRAAFGKRSGQVGYDQRADVNNDGVVDVRDLAFVSQKVAAGTVCR